MHQALIQGLVFCLNHYYQDMLNRMLYFFELMVLIPVFPIIYLKGKKLKKNLIKLPPWSEYLKLDSTSPEFFLLIIGESTAAGVGATSVEKTFASRIFDYIGRKFTIFNIGENGLRAENLKALFDKCENKMAKSFAKTIILIGANDCFKLTPPRKFRQEMESFIQFLIQEKGVRQITIPLIPPVQEFPGIPVIMRFFLGWHRSILTRELELLEKKFPQLSYENQGDTFAGEFFSKDGIHPSDIGYELIAASIAAKIK